MFTLVTSYITVSEAQAKLSDDSEYSEQEIEAAIDFAMALVTKRAGQTFGVIPTQTVYDVRTDSVVLNTRHHH